MRSPPPKPLTEEGLHAWLVIEQKEREAFEQHVKGELRDIKHVLDLLLKAAEIDERNHELEHGASHV